MQFYLILNVLAKNNLFHTAFIIIYCLRNTIMLLTRFVCHIFLAQKKTQFVFRLFFKVLEMILEIFKGVNFWLKIDFLAIQSLILHKIFKIYILD